MWLEHRMRVFGLFTTRPRLMVGCVVAAGITMATAQTNAAQVRVGERNYSKAATESLPLGNIEIEGEDVPPIRPQDQTTTSQPSRGKPQSASPPSPGASDRAHSADPGAGSAARGDPRQDEGTTGRETTADPQRGAERHALDKVRDAAVALADRSIEPKKAGSARGGAEANRDQNSAIGAAAAWKISLAGFIRGQMNRNASAGTPGGVAVVRFTVSPAGDVSGAALTSSSGFKAIDRAALAAISGPMPAAPAGFDGSSLSVTVPLRFNAGD